jgi:hypothetical protein
MIVGINGLALRNSSANSWFCFFGWNVQMFGNVIESPTKSIESIWPQVTQGNKGGF